VRDPYVELRREPPQPGEHGFLMLGPSVTAVSFWSAREGGRMLSREEAEELLGAAFVGHLIGDEQVSDPVEGEAL
jgi:hypothetical protein